MDYSKEELVRIFGSEEEIRAARGLSYVMRSIIINEALHLRVDYDRTLRNLWYASVKPTLEKLGLLRKEHEHDKVMTKRTKLLSETCANMVREGILCYKDIQVVDGSRLRDNPTTRYSVPGFETYGYTEGVAPFPNIILASEKDTMYPTLLRLAGLFGCSCISGKGENALGATEDLLRKINTNKDIYFLTFTDYDPSGYNIAKTFSTQAKVLRRHLHIPGLIHTKRLGITPDQLTQEEVDANKYTPEPSGSSGWTKLVRWFEETGGIDGEPMGLELDALTPDRIIQIFTDALREYITDQTPYSEFVRSAYIRMRVMESIQDHVERIVTDICAQEEDNIEQYDFDVFSLAQEGYTSIPVDELCSNNRDEGIREKAREYFK